MILPLNNQLKPCDNPACLRLTKLGILYCCWGCRLAAEGAYEIHDDHSILAHSKGCDERDAVRRS